MCLRFGSSEGGNQVGLVDQTHGVYRVIDFRALYSKVVL